MTNLINQAFNEEDIRPSAFSKQMKKALHEDAKWLAGKKTEFIFVNCPACDSADYTYLFEKFSFDFVRCEKCETVFMNPRATPEILNTFYSRSSLYDIWNRFVFPSSEKMRRVNIFQPRVKRILDICGRYSVSLNNLLEVGSGYGIFCEEIKKYGMFKNIIAIEPSSTLAETCRSKGIKTIEDSIENIRNLENYPDVVASFEVIEHLFSPITFLMSCKRLMTNNAIIAITCPSFNGFDISTLGLASESIDAEHINLFNPSSIKILFQRAGFSVLECTTPGELDVDIVRNKIIGGSYDVSEQPFLQTVLVDRWNELGKKFQAFLREAELSTHMWVVAKKMN
jgi:SAM-dependent methyltransferase